MFATCYLETVVLVVSWNDLEVDGGRADTLISVGLKWNRLT